MYVLHLFYTEIDIKWNDISSKYLSGSLDGDSDVSVCVSYLLIHLGTIYCGVPKRQSFLRSKSLTTFVRITWRALIQFSSVAQLCPALYYLTDSSMPGFPVHHQLLELAQTHVHRVGGAIQPSHPRSSSFPPTFSLSQHQGLFKWVSSSNQVARVLWTARRSN